MGTKKISELAAITPDDIKDDTLFWYSQADSASKHITYADLLADIRSKLAEEAG